jgi:predicted HicB family RNase H-like nuclease
MADMKTKKMNENEIDRRVVEQADDDSAWEKPVKVKRDKTSLTLPANLAARAAFLARLHRKASLNEWLTDVIQERVELEEAAFADARQAMSSKIE